MKLKKVGLILSTLLLVGGLSGCMNKSGEKEILSYLEDKYNEEFVVENYKSANKLTNQYGGDEAILHLKSNRELVFTAGSNVKKEGGFYDNYSLVKWAHELNEKFKDVVSENIDGKYVYTVDLFSSGDRNSEEVINMSAEEYIDYARDNIRISFNLGIKNNLDEDYSKYNEGIYNILQEIKAYNTGMYELSVAFMQDVNTKEVQDYLRVSNAVDSDWDEKNENIHGKILVTFVQEVSSPEELTKYYKKVGK